MKKIKEILQGLIPWIVIVGGIIIAGTIEKL